MRHHRTLALASLLTALSFANWAAPAQSIPNDVYLAKVPFAFEIGSAIMPADTYEIAPLAHQVLRVRAKDGNAFAYVLVNPDLLGSEAPTGQLRFDTVGEQHFLREFSAPDKESRLHPASRLMVSSQQRRAARALDRARVSLAPGLGEVAVNLTPSHE